MGPFQYRELNLRGFYDYISEDRRNGCVLGDFFDPVCPYRTGAWAGHLEDDNDAGDGEISAVELRARNQGIWVTDGLVDGFDAGLATKEFARPLAEPCVQRAMQTTNSEGMPGVAAGHSDRLKAVEFVAAFLALSPVEELLLGPGFAKGVVHGEGFSTAYHEFLEFFKRGL